MLNMLWNFKEKVSKSIFGAPLTDEEYYEIINPLIAKYVEAKREGNDEKASLLLLEGAHASKNKLQTLQKITDAAQEAFKVASSFCDDYKALYEKAMNAAKKDTIESMLADLERNDLAALTSITRSSNAPNLKNRYDEQYEWTQECHYKWDFLSNVTGILKEAGKVAKPLDAAYQNSKKRKEASAEQEEKAEVNLEAQDAPASEEEKKESADKKQKI